MDPQRDGENRQTDGLHIQRDGQIIRWANEQTDRQTKKHRNKISEQYILRHTSR